MISHITSGEGSRAAPAAVVIRTAARLILVFNTRFIAGISSELLFVWGEL
jgi:hypothetical protein